jgi:hypothetical protein
MYCNVNNIAATVADQLIGPNSWFGFTKPSGITVLRCIATGGSTTANMVGGDGLPTGAGGGSAGGGGGSNASVGSTGASVPGSATYVGVNVGGNLTGWDGAVKQATAANLNATVVGAGTAGTANAGVVTVQGIASMTPVQVSQATASNLNAAVVGTGTAGSAAGGILTVQGVASMTKLLVTPDSVALPANQSVNVSQINGVTPLMGNGVTGTGSPRVTIASDNTAFSVNATLAAETTKVIGTVRVASGGIASGAIASGAVASGAYASGSIAAGAMVDLLTVIGSKSGGTGATNSLLAGGVYNTSAPTLTNGQQAALQFDVNGNLKITGGSAGGTSLADEGTFTQGTTNTTPAGCLFTSSVVNLTTGQAGAVRCTNDRMMLVSDPLLLAAAQAGTATNGSAPSASSIGVGGNGSGATGGLQRLQIICDQHAFFDSTTQLTTLVAGVSGRKIYICGYIVSTGATATNIGLTSGTGTNCASTSVAITPVYKLLANDSRGANSPTWNGLITLANGDNLCQSASAANDHQVEVWYAIL